MEQEQINKPYYEPYLKATEPLFTSERKPSESFRKPVIYVFIGVAEVYTPLEGMGHITMDP